MQNYSRKNNHIKKYIGVLIYGGVQNGKSFCTRILCVRVLASLFWGIWSNREDGSTIPLSNNSTNQTKQLVRNKQTRLINYSKGLTRGEPLPESARGSCGVKPGLFSFIEAWFSIVVFLFVEETRTLY